MLASICRFCLATVSTASGIGLDHTAADMFDSSVSTICRCSETSICGGGGLPTPVLVSSGNTVSSRRKASSRVRRLAITGNSAQHQTTHCKP